MTSVHRRRPRRPGPARPGPVTRLGRWDRPGVVALRGGLVATALATAVATAVPTGVAAAVPPATAGARPPVPSATTAGGDGSYAVIDAAGAVITYGQAGFHGDLLADHLDAPIVGAARSSGGGYWMVASDGGVFGFGDAHFYGSASAEGLQTVVAISG